MSAHAPHYRPLAALEADLRELPGAPRDTGRVALIVRRPSLGVRETPERVRLSSEEGVPGDDWSTTGSRLRVGRALVEVTAKPHNGCLKFKERFGLDALRLVSAKPTRDQNLRGIYWRVVESGEVAVGDEVRVIERARPRAEPSA